MNCGLGLPSVGHCNTAQMIYEVTLAQEAPACPQQYWYLCFRPDWDQTPPSNICCSRARRAGTAHKSLHQGRDLYQGNPLVSSVSDSHDSAIKAEILLASTVIYYGEKSGSRFDTNLTVLTSTQLCAEEAWPSYPTGKADRVAYGVFLLFLISHCPPHCLPSSLRFYIYSFWHFSFLQTFVQEKEEKNHLPKEGLPDSLPETEICDFWDWHETEKEWWHP